MAVSPSHSCSSNMHRKSVLSSLNPYLSEFCNGESVYTGIEALLYQFEPESSPDGNLPVDILTEVPDE